MFVAMDKIKTFNPSMYHVDAKNKWMS